MTTNTTTYIVVDRDDGCELEIVASTAYEAARKFVRKGDYQCDPGEFRTVTVRLRVREQSADEDDQEYITIDVLPPMAEYPAGDEDCEEDDGGTSLGYYDRAKAEECAEAARHNLSLMPLAGHGCSSAVGKIEEYERAGKTIYYVTVVYP